MEYSSCPVCKGQSFERSLICKDYTVSQREFNLVDCKSCGFRFTNPIPDPSKLGEYYKSEDYISHSDTKRGIVPTLYHLVRKLTLRRKLRLLTHYVPHGTVLDYGCGTGMFLKTCREAGWSALGIEPDPGAASLARKHGPQVYSSINELSTTEPEFKAEAITLWHVLEHVVDLRETLSYFHNALKVDGILIVAVPNWQSYDAAHYKQFWAAYDVPRHLYHFTPDTLKKLMVDIGFRVVDTRPMKFDSYYVSLLSEKYKSGSTNLFRAFFNGLVSNIKARKSGNYSSLIYIIRKG